MKDDRKNCQSLFHSYKHNNNNDGLTAKITQKTGEHKKKQQEILIIIFQKSFTLLIQKEQLLVFLFSFFLNIMYIYTYINLFVDLLFIHTFFVNNVYSVIQSFNSFFSTLNYSYKYLYTCGLFTAIISITDGKHATVLSVLVALQF